MTTSDPTAGNTERNASKPTLIKVLLPALAILALVVGGLWLLRSQASKQVGSGTTAAEGAAEVRVGSTLPDFPLRSYPDDQDIDVSSIRAKVILLNFWATWCEPCMVEMPSIIKLHQAYKERGFEVVAVNLDANPATVLPRTIKKFGFSFPIYLDLDSRLADLFQIQSIPLTVVMDGDRKILMVEQEGIDWNGSEFRSALEKWLSG